MPKKFSRNVIFHLNKYQALIIYPVLISCLVACNFSLLCLAYFYYPENYKIIFNVALKDLKLYIPLFLMGISILLLFVVFWTYYVSNKLVGPYQRIIKELDDIIAGKDVRPLSARKGDEMFEELTKRMNVLIERSRSQNPH